MFRHFEILLGVSRLGERWTEKDRQLATQHSACYAFAGQNLSAAISIILELYTIMMKKTKQNLQCVFLVTNGLLIPLLNLVTMQNNDLRLQQDEFE